MLYSIMSRNGFLFNFSATFTDARDIATTVYNFNLEKIVFEGFAKHIYILKQEIRAFREKEDYNRSEKQKIVLKSLILLTYLKKIKERINGIAGNAYHEPLMLTLVNTINLTRAEKEKPDLTLFFQEIERIGKGDVNKEIFEKWRKYGAKKVILKVKDLKELEEIEKKLKAKKIKYVKISDAGLTQLKKGTVTCIGIGPIEEKLIDKITGKLKLL